MKKTLYFDPNKLTAIRHKLGLSLDEFANICGCDIASIDRYETGKTHPRFQYFLKIFCAVQDLKPDIKFTDFLSEKKPVPDLSAATRRKPRGKQKTYSDWKTTRQSL